jgi:NAD(P)-dependent dehydrogenase (short-subunit alcohol dehydrogenase family)
MALAARGAVLVTGTSTGIGRATALRLARSGRPVFASVRRTGDADALRQEGAPGLVPLLFDVTDPAAIQQAARTVSEEVGDAGLAGIVNNAGYAVGGPIEFIDLDDLRRQLEVNVVGVVAVTQAFMPLVRKGRGRIVIVGSVGGRTALPIVGAYAASKFALEGLADALRQELAPSGIQVSLIEPGAIATPMMNEKAQSEGAATLAALEGEAKQLYEDMGQAMLGAFAKFASQAIDPDRVARAIEHALTAPRAKTRYLVGADARVQALMAWLLPDRLHDAAKKRLAGLP